MSTVFFGSMSDGQEVHCITLKNERIKVGLLTLGASIQSLTLDSDPLVIGSELLSDYLGPMQYFGAIVGRVANRIANAKTTIAGKQFTLDSNEENGNCLHGGRGGSSAQVWKVLAKDPQHVLMGLMLPDGHMGFPGKLDVQVRYELQELTLRLTITAASDAQTICSFAPHAYWNLSGEANIDTHDLRIAADEFLPVNALSIPTGEKMRVDGTAFDFRKSRKIGGAALDHNFCLSNQRQEQRAIAWLQSARSGVALEVASTEAGVQVYDARHANRIGLAIEPQVWPDAPNQVGFPSMSLKPGEMYKSVTELRLSKRL